MQTYKLTAICHFGTEALTKREIYDLGYDIDSVTDGRVTFVGDAEAIARANINLRTADRVMIRIGSFEALTFDELFEKVKALPWEEYIPRDGAFPVTKANAINSKLFSSSDIQSIVKKAIVSRLSSIYGITWFEESGASYPVRIFINKNIVDVSIDTTGTSLHKRGYRPQVGKAPISESLAAALIMLSPWRGDRILVDPFCGSGTIPIEAAMMAAHIAPGVGRDFTASAWANMIDKRIWTDSRTEALELEDTSIETDIQGYDISDEAIRIARENARRAGVEGLIHFQTRDVRQLSHPKKYGFIITNPPYGERLSDSDELVEIYRALGEGYRGLDSWSMYIITSYEDAQRYIGRTADKNRKIYNGMIKTYFYEYRGAKPPKRRHD